MIPKRALCFSKKHGRNFMRSREVEMFFPFEKYAEDKCKHCRRAPVCEGTHEAMILCAIESLYKPIGDTVTSMTDIERKLLEAQSR